MSRIYLSVPHMSGAEERYAREAFEANWVTTVGANLDAFEREFTGIVGLPCVALSSGTAALPPPGERASKDTLPSRPAAGG